MKGVHNMSFEKIRWWGKAQKKIKNGAWYYPFLYEADFFETCIIQGFNNPITSSRCEKKIRYKKSCVTFGKIKEDYEKCATVISDYIMSHSKNDIPKIENEFRNILSKII